MPALLDYVSPGAYAVVFALVLIVVALSFLDADRITMIEAVRMLLSSRYSPSCADSPCVPIGHPNPTNPSSSHSMVVPQCWR